LLLLLLQHVNRQPACQLIAAAAPSFATLGQLLTVAPFHAASAVPQGSLPAAHSAAELSYRY
jgi:hypothetical protein